MRLLSRRALTQLSTRVALARMCRVPRDTRSFYSRPRKCVHDESIDFRIIIIVH